MTAQDARQSDELRKDMSSVILDRWRVLPDDVTFGEAASSFADALLPVVTAWHEKAAEAQARARAAEAISRGVCPHSNQPIVPGGSVRPACAVCAWQLQKLADALAAADRTDPA